MVDRPNKPSALAATPGLPPQAQVDISHGNARVKATLPTGESVEVLLYGATVISWRDRAGSEKLWLSEAAALDGSKPVRGGIPLVFPVFGPPPSSGPASGLSQHGFARSATWEFLGKSTSEASPSPAAAAAGDASHSSVKLDFGLSAAALDDDTRRRWPFDFGLIYSVTLAPRSLATSIVITNAGDEAWEFQTLMHTYLHVKDITQVSVDGLAGSSYIDKVDGATTKTEGDASAGGVTITGETDRVYTPAGGPAPPIVVREGQGQGQGQGPAFSVVRDNLDDVVVWNPWADKARGIADFAPADGFRRMLCVEAGAVRGFQRLEPGDAFEGAQVISI